jgi:hypothetical protein
LEKLRAVFDPEDGGSTFLRNIDKLLPEYILFIVAAVKISNLKLTADEISIILSSSQIKILSRDGVTVDGVWNRDRIYWTLKHNS